MKKIVLVLLISVFVLLAFKKVYTSDTLIPNLEPYPDTLYYSIPAWNFVHGNGFVLKTQDVVIKQQTPPLLGIYLIPFFYLFKDVRSFYFGNMLLLILTIYLFVKIIDKIFTGELFYKSILTGFLGFFLITNFYFYSIPQLLMAEPITIFIVTLGIFLYVTKPSNFKAFLSGQLGFLLILIKLSNIPYSVIFTLLFFNKYYSSLKLYKYLKQFLFSLGIGSIYFIAYLLSSGLLAGHKNLGGTDFNIIHFKNGLQVYLKTLAGKAGIRYLWYTENFIPPIIAFLSILGAIIGIYKPNSRKLTLSFVSIIIFTIIFISFFVASDLRYIFAILPAFLLLAGYLIQEIKVKTNKTTAIIIMIIIILATLIFKNQGYKENEFSLLTFKKQIGLNLRHREVPWNYEAIQVFNKFTQKSDFNKTYIATFLPSPFIEIYSNKNYQILPISTWQEFYWLEPELLKKVLGNNLVLRYKELINNGNNVYITHYYKSNVSSQWPKQIDELLLNFSVEKVYDGCLSSCDIYQLKNLE